MESSMQATVQVIERSRARRILEPIRMKPGRWMLFASKRSSVRESKVYDDGGGVLRVLTSRDSDAVRQVRGFLARRMGAGYVESAPRMLKLLSDSEQNLLTSHTFSMSLIGKYNLIALYSQGALIGAASSVSWTSVDRQGSSSFIENVFVAVDKELEGRGLGRLLNSESMVIGFRNVVSPEGVLFILNDLAPNEDSLRKIVRWTGGEATYYLDMPYPIPPLHDGGRVESVIPGIVLVSPDIRPEEGIPKEGIFGLFYYIERNLFGTGDYFETAFNQAFPRTRANLPDANRNVRLLHLGTEEEQRRAIEVAERRQALFDRQWPPERNKESKRG